jgi:hypothetical protein
MCEKRVVNMSIKLHNKLPMELRKEEEERKLTHRLKRYLLEQPYYTLQKFLSEGQEFIVIYVVNYTITYVF